MASDPIEDFFEEPYEGIAFEPMDDGYPPEDFDPMGDLVTDLQNLLYSISSMAGTFDLFEAAVPIDKAEEMGLNVGAARAALDAIASIRSALAKSCDWPLKEPAG